jgi:alpha-tubulin suppressor-like RCC1 family protein
VRSLRDASCALLEHGLTRFRGSGECGQLGLGTEVFEKGRPARINCFQDGAVFGVAGGLGTVVVDAHGKVWTWGCNDQGCLGTLYTKRLTV